MLYAEIRTNKIMKYCMFFNSIATIMVNTYYSHSCVSFVFDLAIGLGHILDKLFSYKN